MPTGEPRLEVPDHPVLARCALHDRVAGMSDPIDATVAASRVPFPSRAWVQHVAQNARPFHLTVAVLVALITVVFAGVVGVLLLVATNFNILDWME